MQIERENINALNNQISNLVAQAVRRQQQKNIPEHLFAPEFIWVR